MANFNKLNSEIIYIIICGKTGYASTEGISGKEAMEDDWAAGDEAWEFGEENFEGYPVDIAD